LIYATSKSFMDYFGINSADELPKISEVMMEELVQATMVNPIAASSEDESPEPAVENHTAEELTPSTEDAGIDAVVEEIPIAGNDEQGSDDEALEQPATEEEIPGNGEADN
jgi:segregation and condensation protein B